MKAKDWTALYNNKQHPDVVNTLKEAKKQAKRYYRNDCRVHGPTVFATLDNSCPFCVRAAQKARRKNKAFNRPRESRNECKRRAKERGIPFFLSTAFIREHTGKVCPVFGVAYEYGTPEDANLSPSIDRLDSSKGYTEDNVAIISTRANRLKNNGTIKEHLMVVRWMAEQEGNDQLVKGIKRLLKRLDG